MQAFFKEEKPLPLSMELHNGKKIIYDAVLKAQKECGLPYFIIEGILSSVLIEIQNGAKNELTFDVNRYIEDIRKDHEQEIAQLKGGKN